MNRINHRRIFGIAASFTIIMLFLSVLGCQQAAAGEEPGIALAQVLVTASDTQHFSAPGPQSEFSAANAVHARLDVGHPKTTNTKLANQGFPKSISGLWIPPWNIARSPLQSLRNPPLVFQSNAGQADARFPYIVRGVNFAAGFTPSGIAATVVRFPVDTELNTQSSQATANTISLSFAGASQAAIVGANPIKGAVNSAIGPDKARWRNRIPSFAALTYKNLYPGIQMVVNGNSGRLEYGFLLEPTSSANQIRIAVKGVEKLRLDSRGNLIMETAGGPIVQTKPRFFEQRAGKQREIKGRFVVASANEYGFDVEQRTPGTSLLIDPEIVFSSYFGGSRDEGMLGADQGGDDAIGRGFDIAIGPNQNLYVIGMTASPDFPVTNSGTMNGTADVFVMRIDPLRPVGDQLVYATFIGGSSSERGRAVAPLEDGRVYITGHTSSQDFPLSNETVQPIPGRSGAYVVRLAPNGGFEIGTRIGRSASYHPNSIVFNKRSVEDQGFVYVAGSVQSFGSSEATPGAFQADFGGGEFDGFLVKLNQELTRYEYFGYLGGAGRDVIMDLDVNDGFAFVTGSTTSVDFPTTEFAAQLQHSQANTGVNCATANRPRQCFDAFVARFRREGTGLVYSTFIGSDREEYARGIGVDSRNNRATVTGGGRATTGDQTDIFVTRLEGGGDNLLFDVRLPARGTDHGEEVVVDPFGNAHVVGTVSVDGLATDDTFHGGRSDVFYARVPETNPQDRYFTYLGGTGEDRGFAVAAAASSEQNFCAAIAGSTTSNNIDTLNALSGGDTRSGGADLLLITVCNIPPILTIQKSGPATVTEGSPFSYIINVINTGDEAVPVVVRDPVPNGVTVTSVSGPGCSLGGNGNLVTCSFSAPNPATAIVITARAGNRCPQTVTNTATLSVGNQVHDTSTWVTQITCIPPLCSNGRLDPGEQCDDGNTRPGDGCSPRCTREVCGNGIKDPGEQCDDGNRVNTDSCSNQCQIPPSPGQPCDPNGVACTDGLVCKKTSGCADPEPVSRGFVCQPDPVITRVVGGTVGGCSEKLLCPFGHVMVGVSVNAGWWLDSIAPRCVAVNPDGTWDGEPLQGPRAGGTGGEARTLTCPRDQAVSGIEGKAEGYIDRLRLRCRALLNADTTTGNARFLGAVGGNGGREFGRVDCPDNEPATGFIASTGWYVDSLALLCGH